MLKGSCLCGAFATKSTDRSTERGTAIVRCGRKAHGAGVPLPRGVRAKDFRWVSGKELITWFESSPGNHRGFCSRCGSPLLSRFDSRQDVYGLPLGCLDTDPGVRPGCTCSWGRRHRGTKSPTHCRVTGVPAAMSDYRTDPGSPRRNGMERRRPDSGPLRHSVE